MADLLVALLVLVLLRGQPAVRDAVAGSGLEKVGNMSSFYLFVHQNTHKYAMFALPLSIHS
jgi:hypothetical protein